MDKKNLTKEVKRDIYEIENSIKKTKSNVKDEHDESFKRFDLIYEKYGSDIYNKFVPKKYRESDMRYLLIQKRFIEFLNKHGEKNFYKYIYYIRDNDITYESNDKHSSWFSRLVHVYVPYYTRRMLPLLTSIFALPIAHSVEALQEKQSYQHEITHYIEDVNDYGEKIKSYNLTDIQNIMIVVSDMWTRIDGYGNPNIDLIAYPGMDVGEEGGVGVCRNMADDTARRLNAINPQYNARTITVYQDVDPEKWDFPDVEMKLAESGQVTQQENVSNEEELQNKEEKLNKNKEETQEIKKEENEYKSNTYESEDYSGNQKKQSTRTVLDYIPQGSYKFARKISR